MRTGIWKTTRLAALAMVALTAASAHAQGNRYGGDRGGIELRLDRFGKAPAGVSIQQSGRDNGAASSQFGRGNSASVFQDGAKLLGTILQTGDNNSATLRQYGKANNGSITQTGSNNAACLIQIGRRLDGSIVQTGGQSTGVIQTRQGNVEFPAELCALEEASRGFWQKTAKGR